MATKTYDPKQVAVVVGAALIDFESVEIGYDEEQFDFNVGVQGEIVRSKNANRLGTCLIRVLQTSYANLSMNALQKLGVTIPILIKDFNGMTVHAMGEGTIVDLPKKTYAKTGAELNEWKVRGELFAVIGGNE